MTRKVRYLLLLAGFIVFLIGAPLIVLYVRGLVFDVETGKFVPTGILAVRSEPTATAIYINDKLRREGEGDIKFLKPGEYNLVLKHKDHYDWYKRVAVRANEVVWAQGESDKIHLLYHDTETETLAKNISDFHIAGNSLAYINGNALSLTAADSQSQTETIQLPGEVLNMQVSPDGNLYLLSSPTNFYLFDRRNKNLEDFSAIIPQHAVIKFSPQNELYFLDKTNLYRANSPANVKLIKDGVKQFTFLGNSLYFVRQGEEGPYLAVSDIGTDDEFTIFAPFPYFGSLDLLVNFQKEVFVLGDSAVYKLNTKLDKLADGVSGWKFDEKNGSLTIIHSGELSYYDFGDKKLKLVNRSSSPAYHVIMEPQLRYVFFGQDGQLKALEIDGRGHQNNYTLMEKSVLKKMMIDEEKKNLIILDDNSLKKIRIR